MDELFAICVVVSTAMEVIAAYAFGTDQSREVNALPAITIGAGSVFGFCCYFHLFNLYLFIPVILLKTVSAYSTFRITSIQKPLIKLHQRAIEHLEEGVNLFNQLIK